MTDTKLNETIPETTTAELDLEKQYARIESVKHKTDFVIGKLRSQMFFSIRTSKGLPPNELAGRYSSLEKAIEAVNHYVRTAKETFSVRSDKLHEERQQRKHAEPHSKNS
jgi:hypothetical protein